MTNKLTEAHRRAVFHDLVTTQDAGVPVPDSRLTVAQKHGLDVDEVRRVEREGLDKEWPPL